MKAVHNHEVRSLPGFRFHPTDEELVGFYLCRKVDKKPMRIDHLIREVDIYKHDPWDLQRTEIGGDNNEGYFFCKRGRKYKNSVRPNRVTGSGFWKATGIDKPVYTQGGGGGNGHESVLGLKKTLVYYRGCAGKGTKTDWMMHEFRLPGANPTSSNRCIQHPQEAEVWTVCRIFKRNANHKRYCGDWRELPTKPTSAPERRSSKTCSSLESNNSHEGYISFNATPSYPGKRNINNMVNHTHYHVNEKNLQFCASGQLGYISQQTPSAASSSSILNNMDDRVEQFTYDNWDELRSVVEFSMDWSHIGTDTSL